MIKFVSDFRQIGGILRVLMVSTANKTDHHDIAEMLLKKELDNTKGVIRIRKSKKDRQHNGKKKKDKRTNTDLHNIKHKTKDRVTRTP